MIGGYSAAQVQDQMWLDSLVDATVLPDGGVPATTNTEALDKALTAYEWLRAMNMTDMNYDQYLAQAGVNIDSEALHRPELVAYSRDWTYPNNTVEPTTGVPASAYSWVTKMNNDKKFFFKEPGFLIGLQVWRPKIYLQRQYASLSHYLDNAFSWMPAILSDNPETSLREFTGGVSGNGPLSNGTQGPANGYWVDMRDLYLYGDQFTNIVTETSLKYDPQLPTGTLNTKYVQQTDVDAMFPGTNKYAISDGVLSLNISGRLQDMTSDEILRY